MPKTDKPNILVIWGDDIGITNLSCYSSGLMVLDWKNQTLTPNPDAIYFMPFLNTAEAGPMGIEVPAADEGSITGSIAGATVLVGHRLRSRHARTRPRHGARQSFVAEPGPPGQRLRVRRHLLRPRGPSKQGIELGSDEFTGGVRSALPLLRSRKVAVREKAWRLPDLTKA